MIIPLSGYTKFGKTKRRTFGFGSLLLTSSVGVVFLFSGIFLVSSSKVDPSWAKTEGTVVDVKRSNGNKGTVYFPIVEYKVEGRSFSVPGSTGTAKYPSIGSTREVTYAPDRPEQARLTESMGEKAFVYIFPVMGAALLLFGIVQFAVSHKRGESIKRLKQTGQKLEGILVDIQSQQHRNTSSHTIVVAASDASGSVRNYVSDTITFIGGLAMVDYQKNPVPIDVYIDPTNPENYYVDIADIPNLSPEKITQMLKKATGTAESSPESPSSDQTNTPPPFQI